MFARSLLLVLVVGVSILWLARSLAVGPPARQRLDRYGDLLPADAAARIGTVRMWHAPDVSALAFSADGKLLASGARDGSLRVWDTVSGKELLRLVGHRSQVERLVFSPDGRTLASAGDREPWSIGSSGLIDKGQFWIRLWDLSTGKERHCLKGPGASLSLAFERDGRTLRTVGWVDDTIRDWDVATGKLLRKTPRADGIALVALSPDARVTVGESSGDERSIHFIDARTGKDLQKVVGQLPHPSSIVFSANGKLLATAEAEETHLWDATKGKRIGRFKNKPKHVEMLAFLSSDRLLLLSWGLARIVELPTGKEVRRFEIPKQYGFSAFALSPDGRRLAAVSFRGVLCFWDMTTGKQVSPRELSGAVQGVALSRDGKILFTTGADETVGVWEARTGREIRRFHGHRGLTCWVACSPDGSTLASNSLDGDVRLWQVSTGKSLGRLSADGPILFTPDSKSLITCAEGWITRWIISPWKRIEEVGAKLRAITSAALSPDGHLLAFASSERDGSRLYSVEGTPLRGFGQDAGNRAVGPDGKPGPGTVYDLAFSPDGATLASWGHCSHFLSLFGPEKLPHDARIEPDEKANLYLWEVATGRLRARLDAVRGKVRSIAFSPDGRFLATGTKDGPIIVWSTVTHEEVRRLNGHRGAVWALAFSTDGQTLATGSEDTTALVWDLRGLLKDNLQVKPLSPGELRLSWERFGSEDAAKAYAALRALAATPAQSIPLIRRSIRPAPGIDKARLARQLSELGVGDFEKRRRASAEIIRMGPWAVPALRAFLANNPDLETHRRASSLLARALQVELTSSEVLSLRAVELLERIGSPEARRTLKQLAGGGYGARLTEAARAASHRLELSPLGKRG